MKVEVRPKQERTFRRGSKAAIRDYHLSVNR
jgi:hypothetical protein